MPRRRIDLVDGTHTFIDEPEDNFPFDDRGRPTNRATDLRYLHERFPGVEFRHRPMDYAFIATMFDVSTNLTRSIIFRDDMPIHIVQQRIEILRRDFAERQRNTRREERRQPFMPFGPARDFRAMREEYAARFSLAHQMSAMIERDILGDPPSTLPEANSDAEWADCFE